MNKVWSLIDERCWDETLRRLGGHLLQSWRWGLFKERQGWGVERLSGHDADGGWMAQTLFKSFGPVAVAYIPCGPQLSGDHAAIFPRMMDAIDTNCRSRRAIALIMEPNQPFAIPGTFKQNGFVRWMTPWQPRATLALAVDEDDVVLGRMHQKMRYKIRLAGRNGVSLQAVSPTSESIAAFHHLLAETADRNETQLLSMEYITDVLHAFGDRAQLLFAMAGDQPVAGTLLVRAGTDASYLFAGSTKENRGQGAGALLIFGSVGWAREHGCHWLDLGNVETEGLRTFKSGFGGVTHTYPQALERRYRPALAVLAHRAMASHRSM